MNDKEVAYILFKDGTPQNEIARYFGKTEQTITKWKKEGNWEQRATEEELSARTAQEDASDLLRYQLRALKRIKEQYEKDEKNGEVPKLLSKGDLDGIRDLFNITKQKEVEWTTYVRIVREINKYLREEHLALAKQMTEPLDEFLNYKRKS